MGFEREELQRKIESHKNSINENIEKAKVMGLNKITAILVVTEFVEEVNKELINWLIGEGYKVSLQRDEYDIISIEW